MKTCDTAVMGHSVASGLDFWNRTCTCDTRDHNTAVWPIPMSHPTSWSHFSVPPSPFLLSRHGDLFASLLPSAHTSQSLPGSQTALTMVSCHCDLIFPLFCTTLLTAFCQLFPTSDIWCFVACCPTPLSTYDLAWNAGYCKYDSCQWPTNNPRHNRCHCRHQLPIAMGCLSFMNIWNCPCQVIHSFNPLNFKSNECFSQSVLSKSKLAV